MVQSSLFRRMVNAVTLHSHRSRCRPLQEERDPQQTEQEAADLEDALSRRALREQVIEPSTGKGPEDHGAEAHGQGDEDDGRDARHAAAQRLDELTHHDDDKGPLLAVDKLHPDADLQAKHALDVLLNRDRCGVKTEHGDDHGTEEGHANPVQYGHGGG